MLFNECELTGSFFLEGRLTGAIYAESCNMSYPTLLTCVSTGTSVLPSRRGTLTYKSIGHHNHRTSTLDFQVWGNIKDLVYKRKSDRRKDIIHGTVDAAPCINDRDKHLRLTRSVTKRTRRTSKMKITILTFVTSVNGQAI